MPSPPADYCRQIEAYLCRKNDGHLIRIVGPAFDKVRGWEDRGIPIKIVLQGIDRTLERRAGSRMKPRRPVRIEFCEADVLDAFDAWRRAVGVVAAAGSVDPVDAGGPSADDETEVVLPVSLRRAAPLQRHIDRAMSRLTQRRLDPALPAHLSEAIDVALAALDGLRARAKGARGHARDEVRSALAAIDASFTRAAADGLAPDQRAQVEREARRELQPFLARMPADARSRAIAAATERLVRTELGLPDLAGGLP